MTFSMNEIESTAKKAARGAGYPWGLAEEAGKATRWLCSHDIDGCRALAGLLQQVDGKDVARGSPDPGVVWTAADGALCPLATGAALSDRAHEIAGDEVRLGEIVQPVLLAPFAALIAQQTNRTISLKWDDAEVTTDGDDVSRKGILPDHSTWASVSPGGQVGVPNHRRNRAEPATATWDALNRFARRTYAPATEDSRLKGAGAGMSDND